MHLTSALVSFLLLVQSAWAHQPIAEESVVSVRGFAVCSPRLIGLIILGLEQDSKSQQVYVSEWSCFLQQGPGLQSPSRTCLQQPKDLPLSPTFLMSHPISSNATLKKKILPYGPLQAIHGPNSSTQIQVKRKRADITQHSPWKQDSCHLLQRCDWHRRNW